MAEIFEKPFDNLTPQQRTIANDIIPYDYIKEGIKIGRERIHGDKDAVTEIIANNVSLETIPEVKSYISNGDSEGLMDYARENLSEEEQKELLEIMSKYVTP